jgi:hypothetical protein
MGTPRCRICDRVGWKFINTIITQSFLQYNVSIRLKSIGQSAGTFWSLEQFTSNLISASWETEQFCSYELFNLFNCQADFAPDGIFTGEFESRSIPHSSFDHSSQSLELETEILHLLT